MQLWSDLMRVSFGYAEVRFLESILNILLLNYLEICASKSNPKIETWLHYT